MKSLKEALIEYSNITERILLSLENNDIDSLAKFFSSREQIINFIGTLKYTREDFSGICKLTELEYKEQRLNSLMENKRQEILKKLNKLFQVRNVNNAYHKKPYSDSMFVYKKI